MTDQGEKCARFAKLHESGIFLIPNPWDVGSACALQHIGAKAIATTSSGAAWSAGRADTRLGLESALANCAAIAAACDIPLNADFENGFAHAPDDVARTVGRCIATGVAGLSIEDSMNDGSGRLYDFDLAVARIRAARAAIDRSGVKVLLTARAEALLAGVENALDEAAKRISAFAAAGADVLFAPGLRDAAGVSTIVAAAGGKPVNVLANGPHFSLAMLGALGVRRVSVGGALARTAWSGFIPAARQCVIEGRFEALGAALSHGELETIVKGFGL